MSSSLKKPKKMPSASMRPPSQKGHPRSSSQGRTIENNGLNKSEGMRSSSLPRSLIPSSNNNDNQDISSDGIKKKVVPRTIKSSKRSPYGQTRSTPEIKKKTLLGRMTPIPIQVPTSSLSHLVIYIYIPSC